MVQLQCLVRCYLVAVCSVQTGQCWCVRVSDQVLSSLGLGLLLLISGIAGTTSLQTADSADTLGTQQRHDVLWHRHTLTMETWGHDDMRTLRHDDMGMCLVCNGHGAGAHCRLGTAGRCCCWLGLAAAARRQTAELALTTATHSRWLAAVHCTVYTSPLYRLYMYSVYCVVAATWAQTGLLARTPSTRPVCPE